MFAGTVLLLIVLGELPLPDATPYGTIVTPAGQPVTQGTLKARIVRGGATVLEAPGVFKLAQGTSWYILNIPLETSIGAPGPSGVGAREVDLVADGATGQFEEAILHFARRTVSQSNATKSLSQ